MKKVTQVDVARMARVERSTVSRIINNDSRFSYSETTRQRIFKAAFRAGYLHHAVTRPRPRAPRKKFNASALIKVRLPDGSVYSRYQGEVINISSTGMLIKASSGGQMPTESFYLEITLTNARLKIPKLKALPVRFARERDQLGLGVQFFDLPANNQLRKLVS